ncbi:hypothetical protein ABT274_09375, partial [Streptomyces sp. NPDC001127]
MDATRVTEQPTSFERPQGADPAEGRGALRHTPKQLGGSAALPVQARTDGTPSGPGTSTPCGKGNKGKEPPVNGPEHSQPAAAEPGAHRPPRRTRRGARRQRAPRLAAARL